MFHNSAQPNLYLPKNEGLLRIRSHLGARHDFFSKHRLAPPQNPFDYREADGQAIDFTHEMLAALAKLKNVKIVDRFDASQWKVNCPSEDGKLLVVVMSPPTHLDWEKPLNELEKDFMHDKPDRLLATWQFLNLVLANLDHGVSVVIIKPGESRKEGTFTRDIAFAIKQFLFLAAIVEPERQAEEWTITGGIKPPHGVLIEGGNVILGKDVIFLGIGDRTNSEALEWLKGAVDKLGINMEVIPIHLREKILHLDCAFCPIEERDGNSGAAIIRPQAFVDERELRLIEKMYGKVKEVSEPDFKKLATNLMSLDRTCRIANPNVPEVEQLLRELRVIPILVEYGELIKAEGAWRCTELAVQREN